MTHPKHLLIFHVTFAFHSCDESNNIVASLGDPHPINWSIKLLGCFWCNDSREACVHTHKWNPDRRFRFMFQYNLW